MDFNKQIEELGQEQIDALLELGQAKNELLGFSSKPFVELPYGVVHMDVAIYLSRGQNYEAIESVVRCQAPNLDISRADGNDLLAFLLWVIEQLRFIIELEKTHLKREEDLLATAAGADRLMEFGALNVLDSLSGGDILKHDLVAALPYYQVYQKLKLDMVKDEVDKAYQKLKSEQKI